MRNLALIVPGDRNWADRQFLFSVLDGLDAQKRIDIVICGHARGADQCGHAWGVARGRTVHCFPAQWEKHGRAAGPIRNQVMLDDLVSLRDSHDIMVVGFHDDFANSRGTQDMIRRSREAGVYAAVVGHDTEPPQPPSDPSPPTGGGAPEERKENSVTADDGFTTLKALREAIDRDGFLAIHQKFWARHRQALIGEPRPLRVVKAVEEMTIAELRDSQNTELPSISDQAYDETGEGALSLSTLAKDERTGEAKAETLGALVPGDHWLFKAFPEIMEDPEQQQRAIDLYEIFGTADEMARRYQTGRKVGYAGPDKKVRDRIEWESYMAQSGPTRRSEHLSVIDGQVRYFNPDRLTRDEYLARRDAFVAKFKAQHGLAVLNAQTYRQATALHRDKKAEALGLLLINDMIEQAERYERLTDDAMATSRETDPEFPYIPSYGFWLYVHRQRLGLESGKWLPLDQFKNLARQATKAAFESWTHDRARRIEGWKNDMDRERAMLGGADPYRHHCRNGADHGSVDELWHARRPEREVDAALVTLGLAE